MRVAKFESVGLFQYHDEPLAASSKLGDKVDETVARERVSKLAVVLEPIYAVHKAAAVGQTFEGYIMKMEDDTLIVRREIQAPEIDEMMKYATKISLQDPKSLILERWWSIG